jgi:hypothetical protein
MTAFENADSARRCRFRSSQQKRASDLDPTYVWIPKLDVAGSSPVSRSNLFNDLQPATRTRSAPCSVCAPFRIDAALKHSKQRATLAREVLRLAIVLTPLNLLMHQGLACPVPSMTASVSPEHLD